MTLRFKKVILLLLLVLFAVTMLGILNGSVNLNTTELLLKTNQPILALRILRIILAIVAGMGLSVSGIVLQAILRNPLAEPYLLGTSSGAGLGAVLALILGLSMSFLPLAAFLGAIASIVLVYNLARQNNKIPAITLVLSGVIVSVALSAMIVFLVSVSGNELLHDMGWWLWGNLQVVNLKLLSIVSSIVIAGIIVIYIFSQDLNAIAIGEEEAMHLGIDIVTVKKILILVTALITASLVSICGIIGFVGLIVPHMMRLVVGPNHKMLIPATCLGSAVFMVSCDIVSRTVFPPLEIPIGVITAIVGAPTFMFLLKRKQKVY